METQAQLLPIESAPRDGSAILIATVSEGELHEIDIGIWQYDPGMNNPNGYEPPYWYWATDRGDIEEPTHWMPLPKIIQSTEPKPKQTT
jgi:hypothetical protein